MARGLSVNHHKTASHFGAHLLLLFVGVQVDMGSRSEFVEGAVIAIQRGHKVGLSIQTKNVVECNALG